MADEDNKRDFFSRLWDFNWFAGSRDSFAARLNESNLFDTEQDVIQNFDQAVDMVRGWLQEKGFKQAELLMDLTLDQKEGKWRKDRVTPAALHEITQAIWFIALHEDGIDVQDPEGVLSILFTHDLGEDFGIKPEEIEQYLVANGIPAGETIDTFKANFDAITKKYGKDGDDIWENEYQYYRYMEGFANASVAKLIDRLHNIMTLVNVQDDRKMLRYIQNTFVIKGDFIDNASENFPDQEKMYGALNRHLRKAMQSCLYHNNMTGKPITDDNDLRDATPRDGSFNALPNGFHPLIFIAERIRQPEQNPDWINEFDRHHGFTDYPAIGHHQKEDHEDEPDQTGDTLDV